jgi:hypothetical protein
MPRTLDPFSEISLCNVQMTHLEWERLRHLERLTEALRLFACGNSKVAISEHFGVHRNTINRWLCGSTRLQPEAISLALGGHASLANRLASRAILRVETECWQWTGKVRPDSGHGEIEYSGQRRVLPRLVWSLVNAQPLKVVGHRCATPRCFNPEHLFQETARLRRKHTSEGTRLSSAIPPGMYEWRGKLRPVSAAESH